MIVTLLVIYSIGLGNTAILTEKFQTIDSCELTKNIIKINLQDKIKSIDCLIDH